MTRRVPETYNRDDWPRLVAQAINGLAVGGAGGGSVAWADITGKPITFPPDTPKGEAVINITTPSLEWAETVTATGVVPSDVVMLSLAPGTDADENDPEMLDVSAFAARPLTDQIEITAHFGSRTSGPVRFNWSAF